MNEKKICLNSFYVTPSLLNSWAYIWDCESNVKESEKDEICLEDKISLAQEKAKTEFIKYLKKEPIELNKYMLQGIEFEKECYLGNQKDISPIIENGCFQVKGIKKIKVLGIDLIMYGKLDVLKGGVIYDIKRVSKYSRPKYQKSYQHKFYLDLFSRAYKFTYLIYDGVNLHTETYYRDECVDLEIVIKNFLIWLEQENLLEIFKENRKWKN